MKDIYMIMAVLIWVMGLAFAICTDNKWRNVGITWLCLITGAILFGIVLTL